MPDRTLHPAPAPAGSDDQPLTYPPFRHQERALATRRAILDAAAVEFDRTGYHASSLTAILRRCGMTKGALYFHFPSKEALGREILAATARAWPPLVERARQRGADPLRTMLDIVDDAALRLASDVVVRAGIRLRAERSVSSASTAEAYLFWEHVFAEQLTQARAVGLLRPGVDPTNGGRLVLGLMLGQQVVAEIVASTIELRERLDASWELVMAALATDQWLRTWHSSRWASRPSPVRWPPDHPLPE